MKLFLLERKFIGVYSLENSIRLLGSQPVSGLCSAMRPNQELPRGSAQLAPNSLPAHQDSEAGCKADPGDYDGARDDGVAFENDADHNMQLA